MYCSRKRIDEWTCLSLHVCGCMCACICVYLQDGGILCEIKGNTASNVQIDVELCLSLALSFSLSQ